MVRCNLQALKHALTELISNAIKFSKEKGKVVVTYRQRDQYMIITVDDNGLGMTEDQVSTALLPFQQIDREQKEQQGTGLGLWLADKIVQVHNGDLRIASVAGKGTRVLVRLPIA